MSVNSKGQKEEIRHKVAYLSREGLIIHLCREMFPSSKDHLFNHAKAGDFMGEIWVKEGKGTDSIVGELELA